jgi:hypothetical protein
MPTNDSLDLVVADYRRDHLPKAKEESAWFGDSALPLADAIERAARSLYPSSVTDLIVMHPHQCRIGHEKMGELARRLRRKVRQLRQATSFDAIQRVILAEVRLVDGVGELAAYDVAHRIGIHRAIRPDLVYLHAGARAGAAALGIRRRGTALPVTEFPPALESLRAEEIEDLLCIFKDRLAALARGAPAPDPPIKGCRAPRPRRRSRC